MLGRTMLLVCGVLLTGVGLPGCGRRPDARTGPSIYNKEVPDGAAPRLGKARKTPGVRLSREGYSQK